jgi:hypothetical protein
LIKAGWTDTGGAAFLPIGGWGSVRGGAMRVLLHPAPRPAPTRCSKLTRDAVREEQSSIELAHPPHSGGLLLLAMFC